MALPYSIIDNIDGLDTWCYDFNRNPTNNSTPTYICTNGDGDYIFPVSKNFVKYVDYVHIFKSICDINHCFPSSGIITWNGTYQSGNSNTLSADISPFHYGSSIGFNGVKVTRNVVVSGVALEKISNDPITITSAGVNIVHQTGIVHKNRGFIYMIVNIVDGYTIPAKSTITVNGTKQGGFGGTVSATPATFTTDYDMVPGNYLLRITDNQYLLSCSIDFPTVSDKPKHSITWHLTNCNVTPANNSFDEGQHTWTFKADSGYRFDQDGEIDNAMGLPVGTITAAGTDTINWTYDLKSNVDVTLSANKVPQTVTTIPLSQKITNATSNVSGAEIDRKINQIIITANTGYQFKDDILVQLYTGETVTQSFNVAGNNDSSVTLTFNTNSQNTITDSMTNVVITANAVKPETSTGYAHYYAISNTELHQFSKEHIWDYVGSSTESDYDVSKYIDNLIELPLAYDTTNLPTSPIAVGRIATATTTHEIKDRFYTLDFGKITVPAKYKNGYDYHVRTCKLYLPFAPAVSIAIDNAMEQVIHITYKIDISTGNATITLDNDGIPFNTMNVSLADTLPFLNTLQNTIIRDGQHQIYNGIRNPYLVITRNQPVLNSDYYPTNEQNKISNYQGRIQATMLDDTVINDPNDLAGLQRLLAEGVIYHA